MGRRCGTAACAFLFVSSLWLLWISPADAQRGVHRWRDQSGRLWYTDYPPQPHEVWIPARTNRYARTPPAASSSVARASIDSLLEASGVKRTLEGATAQAMAEIEGAPGIGPDERAALQSILPRHLRGDLLYPSIRDKMRLRAEKSLLEGALAFYRSPLGKKLVSLEIASTSPEAVRERRQRLAGQGQQPPPGPRTQLVARIEAAAELTHTLLDTASAVGLAVARALASTRPAGEPSGEPPDEAAIRQALDLFKAQAWDSARDATISGLLESYAGLTDAELIDYARFLETEPGRWFSGAMGVTVMEVMAAAMERTMAAMVRSGAIPSSARASTAPEPAPPPRR